MYPDMPPSPETEPTARLGNRSPTSAYWLALNPWCPAVASPSSSVQTHGLLPTVANITGTTRQAQTSMAVLRAALVVVPRFIIADESHPPPMLPSPANV